MIDLRRGDVAAKNCWPAPALSHSPWPRTAAWPGLRLALPATTDRELAGTRKQRQDSSPATRPASHCGGLQSGESSPSR